MTKLDLKKVKNQTLVIILHPLIYSLKSSVGLAGRVQLKKMTSESLKKVQNKGKLVQQHWLKGNLFK
jgi:hypothetical protein